MRIEQEGKEQQASVSIISANPNVGRSDVCEVNHWGMFITHLDCGERKRERKLSKWEREMLHSQRSYVLKLPYLDVSSVEIRPSVGHRGCGVSSKKECSVKCFPSGPLSAPAGYLYTPVSKRASSSQGRIDC